MHCRHDGGLNVLVVDREDRDMADVRRTRTEVRDQEDVRPYGSGSMRSARICCLKPSDLLANNWSGLDKRARWDALSNVPICSPLLESFDSVRAVDELTGARHASERRQRSVTHLHLISYSSFRQRTVVDNEISHLRRQCVCLDELCGDLLRK